MKVKFITNLENGNYHVRINVYDFTSVEIENMKKFGPPMISIMPQRLRKTGLMTHILPLHDLDYDFLFGSEEDAVQFMQDLTERIKAAAAILQSKKDNFTGEKEIIF